MVTLLGMAGAVTSRAAELAVAAASDLKYALDELVAEFRTNQPGTRVRVTYGSSGNFFAQLQNRAPFDLYLSADLDYPRRLAAAGHALDTNVFLYAIGRIVVWVPSSSSVDVEQMGVQSLVAPSVKKIAIANPRHAPYGRAAVEAMKSLRIYDHVEPQLVLGENTAQAAQFVQAGGADLGIIALSLALAPPLRSAGRFWEVPLEAYPRMEQGGVILRWTKEAGAARTFRDFVLGPRGRGVLKQYGFFPPEQ
ncbi:MAG TPA: molybdate ABC transporter substrate-binding protein [Methylomirabilota bacterium]|nr:molybdate ABC transporter substrate-binding protein [Methylomirabilota bacterium]